jgi:hypothetical protein
MPTKNFRGATSSFSVNELHFFGGAWVVVGGLLVGYYFKLRRDLNK